MTTETWWDVDTREEFMAAHRRELPRILTDKEGMRLVPIAVMHELGIGPKRKGFAGTKLASGSW